MRNKYYIHAIGGTGDHLTQYFGGHSRHRDFGYLWAIKDIEPNCYVKAIFHPAFPDSVINFFEFEPRIDEVVLLPWKNPNARCRYEQEEAGSEYIKLSKYAEENNISKITPDKIYTTEEDDRIVNDIKNKGDYIVFHPFASGEGRIVLSETQYKEAMKKIVIETGMNVVIIGASSNKRGLKKIKESIDIEEDKIINMVNKTNMRTASSLVWNSKVLVANNSAFGCLLCQGHRPLVMLTRDGLYNSVANGMRRNFVTNEHVDLVNVTIENNPIRRITTSVIRAIR